MIKAITLVSTIMVFFTACQTDRKIALIQGLHITESATIRQDTFYLNGSDSLNQPVITIEGQNLAIDFNGAVLIGSNDQEWPDAFYGTAILVKGENITLKNLTVRGFKVALMAEGVDSLKILDSDFSYNYRQRLKSIREREDFSDWLSYHQNDNDEWLRYGAALYLKDCDHALVRNIRVTGGQNGIMLTGCDDSWFYNNTIQFNSGVGIGLYRSSRNRVMHNRLDWNVRGYSHGIYQRGQDSAALLVYEQSSDNTFAYNSATHSGDGFFLWAGQTTMDTGEGGCNGNVIYKNDFSYAPTNGIEVTFSSNTIAGNKMTGCRYGIWGGYSYHSIMAGNEIEDCEYGIAIEHGNNNEIVNNTFRNLETGIRLWERKSQPADWGFGEKRDVSSRDYVIRDNRFSAVRVPLKISGSKNILVSNTNAFDQYETLLVADAPNEGLQMDVPNPEKPAPPVDVPPLPDGMDVSLSGDQPTGRSYILVDEWGPYDFRSPSIWLRNVEGDQYTFLIQGPAIGNYKIVDGEGWARLSRVSGALPATLVATRKPDAEYLSLQLEYIGEAFTDRFGNYNKRGKAFPFSFRRFEKELNWRVRFYNYDDTTDPLTDYEAFSALKDKKPDRVEEKDALYYAWWGSPGEGVQEDRFATFAETTLDIEPGQYRIMLTSDDGARLYVDNELRIDHWDIHEPVTDEVSVELGGAHNIRIEHFEAGGFGTLGFRIEK